MATRNNEQDAKRNRSENGASDAAIAAASNATARAEAGASTSEPPAARPTPAIATPATDGEASAFERQHVHSVYSVIAPHFSSTRYKAWPKVAEFVSSLPAGSIMLDVGSGNGKNLGLAKHVTAIGCDISRELLSIGRARGFESQCADGLRTAFRSGIADAVISIAVVHHFATPARRAAAVRELVRLLRPGGLALIYVWAKEQAKDRGGVDVLIDWEVHQKFDDAKPVLRRYYHLFERGELEALVAQVDGATVRRSYFDKENWVVVVQKAEAPFCT